MRREVVNGERGSGGCSGEGRLRHGPAGEGRAGRRLRAMSWVGRLLDPLEQPLPCLDFLTTSKIGMENWAKDILVRERAYLDRNEPILVCGRILGEAGRPLGEGKVGIEVMVRQDRQRAVRLGVR